jgi:hypothetical protein
LFGILRHVHRQAVSAARSHHRRQAPGGPGHGRLRHDALLGGIHGEQFAEAASGDDRHAAGLAGSMIRHVAAQTVRVEGEIGSKRRCQEVVHPAKRVAEVAMERRAPPRPFLAGAAAAAPAVIQNRLVTLTILLLWPAAPGGAATRQRADARQSFHIRIHAPLKYGCWCQVRPEAIYGAPHAAAASDAPPIRNQHLGFQMARIMPVLCA